MRLTQEDKRKAEVMLDKKAGYDTRKRTNRAPDRNAGIDADTIDKGITLEQLGGLNVPVFRYQTQITIHGGFPGLDQGSILVCGYKSLIINKNGSLGVKYRAIDAAKKRLLAKCVSLGDTPYSVYQDSQGYALESMTECTQEALERLQALSKAFPDNLIVGRKQLYKASTLYGTYLVLSIQIDAIPQSGLWELISHVTGIGSQSELDSILAIEQAKRDKEREEYKAKREVERAIAEKRMAADTEQINAIIAQRLTLVPTPQLNTRYILPGLFGYERKPGFAVVEYRKAFGKLSRRIKVYSDVDTAIDNLNIEYYRKGKTSKGFGKSTLQLNPPNPQRRQK